MSSPNELKRPLEQDPKSPSLNGSGPMGSDNDSSSKRIKLSDTAGEPQTASPAFSDLIQQQPDSQTGVSSEYVSLSNSAAISKDNINGEPGSKDFNSQDIEGVKSPGLNSINDSTHGTKIADSQNGSKISAEHEDPTTTERQNLEMPAPETGKDSAVAGESTVTPTNESNAGRMADNKPPTDSSRYQEHNAENKSAPTTAAGKTGSTTKQKTGPKKYIPVKKEPKKLDPQQIKQLEKDNIIKMQGEISLAPLINKSQVIAYLKEKLPNYDNLKVKVTDEKNFAEFLSVACEEWMNPILKDMVVYSRHRRRPIRAASSSNSTAGTLRSEVAKSLRDIAIKQKELEEKREARKKEWGIGANAADKVNSNASSNGGTSASGTPGGAGSQLSLGKLDEMNRRQANATASLMTSGRSKTYSWMTGGSSMGLKSSGALGAGSGADGKVRYREARQEEIFAVRDLVKALEKKRKGVEKTLSKGYGKLKDVYR